MRLRIVYFDEHLLFCNIYFYMQSIIYIVRPSFFMLIFPEPYLCHDSVENKVFTLHKGRYTLICVNMTKPEAIFMQFILLDMYQHDHGKNKISNFEKTS